MFEWLQNLVLQYGYLGFFLISLIGSLSIFIPIPYTVIIFAFGASFEPLWIAVAAGVGSAIGEFSGYALGYFGRRTINEKYRKKMDVIMRLFERFGVPTVFIFALTPLPDDLLFIPLGVMHYNPVKTFCACLAGKFCMSLIVAYGGRYAIQLIKFFFGVESNFVSIILNAVVAVLLLIGILIVMFKLDWEKLEKKLK